MINSDFDTIIRNDNNFQNKPKSKFKIFILIFLLLFLVSGGVLGYMYYSKYTASIPKMKFFEYVDDTNLSKMMDTTLLNAISEKMSNSSYSVESEILINTQDENIKMPMFKLNYKKNNDNYNSAELIINKSEDKELIRFSLLNDSENIGIKSDDIVIKYVGFKKSNFNNIIQKINLTNSSEEYNVDFSLEPKIEILNKTIFEKYINIINTKLTEDKFTIEENVLLTQNDSSMQTILYELKLSKEEVLNILTETKNQLVNDQELINCFITGKEVSDEQKNFNYLKLINGCKIDITTQEVTEIIEQYFNDMYSKILSEEKFDYLYFDIYVNNETVLKKSIRIGEYLEIDFEEKIKSENENYAKLTVLTLNESNQKDALILSVNRLNNNVSTIVDVELSTTENSQINNKLSINTTLEGNANSKNLNNEIIITYSNANTKVTANLMSKLQFGIEEEIERLNSENCLFIDVLDSMAIVDILNQIVTRSKEVFELKSKEFSQEDLVLENPNIVEELVDMDGQTDEEKKKEAQDKLVAAISNEMTLAEQENKEYALTDLQGLEIEGSTVSVMVGENFAIIAIDGYTFNIDPNFVLTAE